VVKEAQTEESGGDVGARVGERRVMEVVGAALGRGDEERAVALRPGEQQE